MRRTGAARSVAWKHYKRKIQLRNTYLFTPWKDSGKVPVSKNLRLHRILRDNFTRKILGHNTALRFVQSILFYRDRWLPYTCMMMHRSFNEDDEDLVIHKSKDGGSRFSEPKVTNDSVTRQISLDQQSINSPMLTTVVKAVANPSPNSFQINAFRMGRISDRRQLCRTDGDVAARCTSGLQALNKGLSGLEKVKRNISARCSGPSSLFGKPELGQMRSRLRTRGDVKVATVGYVGMGFVLNHRAESSLIGCIPVDSRLCMWVNAGNSSKPCVQIIAGKNLVDLEHAYDITFIFEDEARKSFLIKADMVRLWSDNLMITYNKNREQQSFIHFTITSLKCEHVRCSDVKIQMRPTCVDGVVVTRSPRMSDVRGSNPGTATGYALLMSSNKSETRVQCFPLTVRNFGFICQKVAESFIFQVFTYPGWLAPCPIHVTTSRTAFQLLVAEWLNVQPVAGKLRFRHVLSFFICALVISSSKDEAAVHLEVHTVAAENTTLRYAVFCTLVGWFLEIDDIESPVLAIQNYFEYGDNVTCATQMWIPVLTTDVLKSGWKLTLILSENHDTNYVEGHEKRPYPSGDSNSKLTNQVMNASPRSNNYVGVRSYCLKPILAQAEKAGLSTKLLTDGVCSTGDEAFATKLSKSANKLTTLPYGLPSFTDIMAVSGKSSKTTARLDNLEQPKFRIKQDTVQTANMASINIETRYQNFHKCRLIHSFAYQLGFHGRLN
ncbi:hypothetical protein CLF_105027 [Clonorchis sinensis]|uniref:Uncharacterized protein n=1 Tax=Clonorchis sinensis TaxID=79923 RepID=G7YCT9_CLOSI|nr:hypothetical protein CLF_105027 [Clonorchis sinensis]